jgi:hypothetical protein
VGHELSLSGLWQTPLELRSDLSSCHKWRGISWQAVSGVSVHKNIFFLRHVFDTNVL